MKYTEKQKAYIRGWWAFSMDVRFMADGSVQGKEGASWGLLWTARQAREHLQTRGLI